jgi:hypothetical protein
LPNFPRGWKGKLKILIILQLVRTYSQNMAIEILFFSPHNVATWTHFSQELSFLLFAPSFSPGFCPQKIKCPVSDIIPHYPNIKYPIQIYNRGSLFKKD